MLGYRLQIISLITARLTQLPLRQFSGNLLAPNDHSHFKCAYNELVLSVNAGVISRRQVTEDSLTCTWSWVGGRRAWSERTSSRTTLGLRGAKAALGGAAAAVVVVGVYEVVTVTGLLLMTTREG